MSKIGFGGYRISQNSQEHKEALSYALEKGVKYIDTSSNYTDGESEKLIGEVLSKSFYVPRIISKVGYIQGQNLDVMRELNDKEVACSDLVEISADLKHSIHPDFIEDQIHRSLERLKIKKIDIYLLHNPEYYLKTEGSTKSEYYRRIKSAFIKLEDLVSRGLIDSYGVSSNTFIDPREDHETTDLKELYEISREISNESHFKYIQFPMNILEMGALERQYEGEHLIEFAHSLGIKTIGNRPLNCFSEHGLLRLAQYEVDEKYYTNEYAEEVFNKKIEPLVVKWLEVREDESDKLFDIPLMRQVSEIWYKQNSIDAVDQVFQGYFFPLIANVWGGNLTAEQSQPFYELCEHGYEFAKANMNIRARQFEQQAILSGLLYESDKSLPKKVIEKYFSFGLDITLVGMRKKIYVDDLKNYF